MAAPIPVSYYRGGTSKALFFHARDIPPAGPVRDAVLKRLKGSPDPMQIDGMGGTHIVTSKIAVIAPSEREGVDVDYTFCQVSVKDDHIDYSGNCGNISAAVGPFAITEGLVKEVRVGVSPQEGVKTQMVRMFVTGTGKVMEEHVPVDSRGNVITKGDYAIDGCPGTGAPILIDMKETIGGACGKGVLPSGQPVDVAEVVGKQVEYTICDVANIVVFARAEDLGINGDEKPGDLDQDVGLLNRIRELRGRAAQKHGMCADWQKVDQQAGVLPMVALVSEATESGGHVQSRFFLDNKCHTSMAGTGSVCHAACSRVKGTIVNQMLKKNMVRENVLNIQHPLGLMPAAVKVNSEGHGTVPDFDTLSFVRTSRRIFKGELDVPDNIQHLFTAGAPTEDAGNLTNGSSEAETHGNSEGEHDASTDATTGLAKFVTAFNADSLPVEVLDKLKSLLLDYVGVTIGAVSHGDSTPAFISTMETASEVSKGHSTVFGHGSDHTPARAAFYNAALAHTLDFDDTFVPGSIHIGATVISTALAEVEHQADLPSSQFLAALAVGYEVVARLSRAISIGGYAQGFHNTSTCGIFGAVAVVARLRGLDVSTLENAFGLAISKASGSMQYLENGSWNKRLHPGFAAADAFMCVELAENGVIGAAKPIEGKYGLLNCYASGAKPETLELSSLGTTWAFLETAVKPYPACRMTHGQVEMASAMRAAAQGRTVEAVIIGLPKANVPVVGARQRNKIHPQTIVDAQFSAYFQTAMALLHGDDLGWSVYDHIRDEKVNKICNLVSIEGDSRLQGIESWLKVEWSDGSISEDVCLSPKGEKERPIKWDDVRKKFDSLMVPVHGKVGAEDVAGMIQNVERSNINALMRIVGSNWS